MHIYKYIHSRFIILHKHISVIPATIISASFNTNTISIQINLQKMYDTITLIFHSAPYGHKISNYIIIKTQ